MSSAVKALIVLSLLSCAAEAAQTATTPTPEKSAAPVARPDPPKPPVATPAEETPKPRIRVCAVKLPQVPEKKKDKATQAAGDCKPDTSDPVKARLGESIVLQVTPGLSDYLDYAKKQKKGVTLFLDGNDTGVTNEAVDYSAGTLQFRLDRNGDNKKIWAPLLRDPFHHQERSVDVSIGLAGGNAEPAAADATFTLVVIKWAGYAWFWLALLFALLAAFLWLVVRYDMLRDGKKPSPFSLGQCQMAWWFLLIVSSYVMIWLISGDRDTLSASLLTLMGISAGTALGAALIETGDGSAGLSQAATDRLALLAAQQNAQAEVRAAQAAVTAAPGDAIAQKNLDDAQAKLAVVNAKLTAVNNRINGVMKAPQSHGFLRDILGDSDGVVGLHRFQVAVWTLVLGIIFVVSVVIDLAMPEFSPTLLALMGISAGTYLGFKFPEK